MKLYNVLTQTIEPFQASEPVKTYVCGITPYDTTHLGHAFTYTTFDILIRYLEYQGHTVRYVQNVTDIDDDILRKAREVGENWRELGNRCTAQFIADMRELNVRPPDFYPRASDIIPDIIDWVQKLLDKGIAYEKAGNVYYHIETWPEFGKLSHLDPDDMLPIANERGNFPDDPHKQNPLDFVLWQAQKPGEPAWDSPWGPGRPGWHIECSVMSLRYLGETIDIHGGGGDLVFPHHECGLAQIEPITKKVFTRLWMHVAMVYHEGEKMSKSLGNLVMVQDLLETYSADAIRLYLANHHYRHSWSYDEHALAQMADLANLLREAVTLPGGTTPPTPLQSKAYRHVQERFLQAMADDLDTPTALVALKDLATEIREDAGHGYDVHDIRTQLATYAHIFGLRLDSATPEPRVVSGWNNHLTHFT